MWYCGDNKEALEMMEADQMSDLRGRLGSVVLVSAEGDKFEVTGRAAELSKVLKVIVEEGVQQEVPLSVPSSVLAKVVEFIVHHSKEPMEEIPKPIPHGKTVSDHVQEWYREFLSSLSTEMTLQLVLAANYLDVQPLLNATCAKVGLEIMNKTPDQIREAMGIEEPFSEEVERHLRNENKWSSEPMNETEKDA